MINKYTIVGTLGILIFSSGLCVLGEAIIRKSQNLDFFLIGTISLVLINLGVCIMIKTKELSS
tara:strand:+ start:412 stop:600 length:189 start_codon:yes stop_codon:yes gene_type:complete